jgi:hypothetical protein
MTSQGDGRNLIYFPTYDFEFFLQNTRLDPSPDPGPCGICIYDAANYVALFEMQVMSMYQHLNDERADILKQHMSLANE